MVGFTCGGNSFDLKSELRQFFKGDDEKTDNINSEKKLIKELHMSISGYFAQYIMKQERLNSSINQDHYLEIN